MTDDFYSSWRTLKGDPAILALEAGRLAGNMSDVFCGGYQCAMRAVFPALPRDQWSALCVSEGRFELPPVTVKQQANKTIINGYKTWVAAADRVSVLVVKVGRGDEAFLATVLANTAGVTLTIPEESKFLAQMGQGIVQFENVVVERPEATGREQLRHFMLVESLYIYLAFLGFLAERNMAVSGIASRLQTILAPGTVERLDHEEIAAVDRSVQALVSRVPAEAHPENWAEDQRLIRMYSPMIQKRVEV